MQIIFFQFPLPLPPVQCRPLCVCVRAAGDWGSGLGELHVYYWDETIIVRTMRQRVDLHWRINLMTFFTFAATLAAIGLVRGDMENALDCCVVGNISVNSWWLHAPALLLLVLPRKSNMLPDLSASELLCFCQGNEFWQDF